MIIELSDCMTLDYVLFIFFFLQVVFCSSVQTAKRIKLMVICWHCLYFCNFNIGPWFLNGSYFHFLADTTKHKHTLQIHAVAGSPIENLPSDLPKPELDFQLTVTEPLVTTPTSQETNLLNVTIESLYSPPDTFQLTGQQFAYVASLPLPLTAEVSVAHSATSGCDDVLSSHSIDSYILLNW